MDVDAYVAHRARDWDRLADLSAQRRLSGAQADELASLYQAAATDLSKLRSAAPDPTLTSRLSGLLARGRARMDGTYKFRLRDITTYFSVTIPLAFYRVRHLTLIATLVFIGIGVGYALWAYSNPDVLATLGTEQQRRSYAEEAFAAYYSNYPAPDFAAQVWTNNAWISAQMIGGGITGIFPIYVLGANAVGVGQAGAIMAEFGYLDVFFALILPHGLMELTAIFVAFALGFQLFLAWAIPGDHTRSEALARQGRLVIPTVIGLAVILGISGLVEGFVTPSTLPAGVKIAIGALVLALYWLYTYALGGRAARTQADADGKAGTISATLAAAS